jgi:hypothetical protein
MSVNEYESMIGLVMDRVDGTIGDDTMVFHASNGKAFTFWHEQDCCESVSLDDIIGDLSDLEGSPILYAEAVDNMDEPPCDCESYTWTFYRFGTAKGSVTVRWFGTSNGYYSEGVNFSETP